MIEAIAIYTGWDVGLAGVSTSFLYVSLPGEV